MEYRVLLIEDDDDDYMFIKDLVDDLRGSEIDLVRVNNYGDGLKTLLDDDIKICLIDYRIGAESGVDFIQKLNKIGCCIPMILLTGAGDNATDLAAQTAGAAYYLDKQGLEGTILERALRYAGNQHATISKATLPVLGPHQAQCNSSIHQPENDVPYILLIDDDEDDFLLAKELLKDIFGRNLRLDWISSWQDADAAISSSAHDVIIIDYRLGERNGLELVEEAVQFGCKSPFIVLTGEGNREIDLEAMRVGATDYLIKGEITAPLLDRSIRYAIERHRAERRLAELAQIDQLTGLANRYRFRDFLDHAAARADRYQHRVALMLIDLNRFKIVNDTHGHAAGDILLQEIANRLRSNVRGGDLVARLGGDEFTIVMTDIVDLDLLNLTANRILDEIAKPVSIGHCEVEVGCSIGIALYPDDAASSETLIVSADTAMYAGKEDRIAAFNFYTAEMRQHATRRLELEMRLRRAVDERQFELFYQPQIELSSGKLVGFEALLRWHHPTLGLVPPGEFIELAEESQLITEIGTWVLETSCAQLAAWREADLPEVRVAVNFSAKQFCASSLIDLVVQALDCHRLPANLLEIEITESDIFQKPSEVNDILKTFSDLGIRVALDDFGTGYSSLNHLRAFPGSAIKIDQSFIHDITNTNKNKAIVRSLIDMAHNLGLTVVGEGVESNLQLDYLRETGCDIIQGYLISRPKPAALIDRNFFSRMERKIDSREVTLLC